MAVLIARFTTPNSIRDSSETVPGGPALPAPPGPATALMFDLLACMPALLVLLRRAADRHCRLALYWSQVPLFALCVCAAASTTWSADRFAAAVSSAGFFAAACLLWAMSQLIRSPLRLRTVAAISFGLLMVLVVHCMIYRFLDAPADADYFREHKNEILKEHNWEPDSFAARQYELKVNSGELVGIFNSPNTVAAVCVLLFFACAGIGLQKCVDGESKKWLVLTAIAAVSLIWVLINARSKTSAVSPLLGVAILTFFFLLRQRSNMSEPPPMTLNNQPGSSVYLRTGVTHTFLFLCCTGLIVIIMMAIIGHGLYHHGLFPGHFSNSLDFRWKYWVASAGIFKSHPLIGVGWENFGYHYLAQRLPDAVEEIKDPHNFLVRMFTELGLIGGILCIIWLLRTAWEITQPQGDTAEPDPEPLTIKSIAAIVVLGMVLSIIANVDFSLSTGDVITFLLKPILYLLALLLGGMGAAMLSQHSWAIDDRPAPWVLYPLVTGLGLFLIHNLIDFGWFEAGGMMLFMMLIGSAQGMSPACNRSCMGRPIAILIVVAAAGTWLTAAIVFVAPIWMAEQSAAQANESIRTADRSNFSAHYHQAIDDLASAAQLAPYNSDYVFREAQACISAGDATKAKTLLARAKEINPMQLDAYLLDANLRLSQPNADASAIRGDFTRVLQLNPNDVSLHMQYARALEHSGLESEAREQYRLALHANDALPPLEPRRLSPAQVSDLTAKAYGS